MTGTMAVMGRQGDTKTIWNKNNPDEVAAARATFDTLRARGYLAFRVKGKSGEKGEQITEFDPTAEAIILAPPLRGG